MRGVELNLLTGLVVHAVVETGATGGAAVAADAAPADAPPAEPTAPESATAPTMRDMELDFMRQTLERCGGNVSKAARQLGVSRNTIYRRLARE